MNRVLYLVVAALFLGAPATSQTSTTSVLKFKLQKKHALQLVVPSGWRVEQPKQEQGVLTLSLVPETASPFKFLLSGFVIQKGEDAPLRSPEEMKLMLNLFGAKALEHAIEKDVAIGEAQGKQGVGYFYHLTDKREPLPPGEFRYLWQALFAVGEIRVTATLLSDAPGETLSATALRVLETAEDVKP